MLLKGRPAARAIVAQARDDIADFATQHGFTPSVAVVNTGDDPSAVAYARAIERTSRSTDVPYLRVDLPSDVTIQQFDETISQLNDDPRVGGIIVLQPLPPHLPKARPAEIVKPSKDIDGITLVNIGRLDAGSSNLVPSTPAGGVAILHHYEIPIAGKHVVIVGRSLVVGKPLAMMLLAEDATITICHSRTPDLARFTRQADIIALAAGRPGILTPDMVDPKAVVLDFGVTVIDGTLTGDADPGVAEVVRAITPVPGGTGVVTNAILMRNLAFAVRQLDLRD
ncbi:MAG TPA: bifunctional 5,10-methylenetetrahydrofolate dehydrogenase/5,10-methenyltetrahydrofolate cyclohydrolase [Nitrolancea sp.]